MRLILGDARQCSDGTTHKGETPRCSFREVIIHDGVGYYGDMAVLRPSMLWEPHQLTVAKELWGIHGALSMVNRRLLISSGYANGTEGSLCRGAQVPTKAHDLLLFTRAENYQGKKMSEVPKSYSWDSDLEKCHWSIHWSVGGWQHRKYDHWTLPLPQGNVLNVWLLLYADNKLTKSLSLGWITMENHEISIFTYF